MAEKRETLRPSGVRVGSAREGPARAPPPLPPDPTLQRPRSPTTRGWTWALESLFRIAAAVAIAAGAFVALRIHFATRRPPPPDRAQLLAGPVTVEVEAGDPYAVRIDASRIEARGPAAYVARLWDSKESFERGADVKTRTWAAGTGLVPGRECHATPSPSGRHRPHETGDPAPPARIPSRSVNRVPSRPR